MFQIIEPDKKYDAIVVGSGAGGGMSAKVLAEQGLKVAIVEAGPYFDPKDPKTMTQLKPPWMSPRRGAGTNRVFGDFDMAYGGWDLPGQPYTMKDDTNFMWYRSQMLGGRTNHWGRISLRFGPRDFKKASIDGIGEDWPISYDDIKPYYDKLDKMLGIFGTKEGLPNEPDGYFLPPPKPRLHELYYIKGAKKVGVTVIPSRLSILTKRINQDRGVCFYCAQCNRSCSAYADFSAGSCLIFPAQKNGGQIDLYTDCIVRKVNTNSDGLATGVTYINKEDRQEYKLNGKLVMLGASSCSSTRILFNSSSAQHPDGLGNNTGNLGRYLHDSTGSYRGGFVPALMDRDMYNEDGVGGMHVYSPWWLDNKKLDFPRGYHIEVWGGLSMPNYGFGMNVNHANKYLSEKVGGFGTMLKEDARRYFGAFIGFGGRGEGIAYYDNYCELDPNTVDEYGIPVLRFKYDWSDHERNQAKHMQETFEKIIDAMGGHVIGDRPTYAQDNGLNKPGEIIHEAGTTRMGNDPNKSVVNKYQQLHDCKNVYVVDGGPIVQQADKNLTWTIMALSMRATEHAISELKKMNI